MQQVNCMNMSKEQLLCFIDEVSFAVVDMNLYLDTHPCDKAAEEYLKKYAGLRRMAMQTCASKYGPMSIDFITSDSCMSKGGEY